MGNKARLYSRVVLPKLKVSQVEQVNVLVEIQPPPQPQTHIPGLRKKSLSNQKSSPRHGETLPTSI